jgi:hypothetical protein
VVKDSDDDEDVEDEEDALPEERAPRKVAPVSYDDVPTWAEAISYLVVPRDKGPSRDSSRGRGRGRN